MKTSRVIIILVAVLFLISAIMAGCTPPPAAQPDPKPVDTPFTYPERPITVIVGFNPGGPTDVIARGIIPVLQEKIGVGIGIVNMAGASSSIAANYVLDQKTDGYTLFYGSEIMSIWQTMGTTDLAPTKDFIPIKLTSQATPVLAVPPGSKFTSPEQFIQYAKDNPGKLRIGTAGPGTVPHISGLLLSKVLGCEFTFVPFQGGAAAIAAAMGGHVDATIEMLHGMVDNFRAGKLNILTCFTNEPLVGLDVVPLGKIYPDLSKYLPYGPYFGLFAAKETPVEIIDFLRVKMEEAMADQRWIDYCNRLYLRRIDYSGEAAEQFLKEWTSRATWLLYDAGGAKNSPADFGIERPKD
jgi:tripartite-type tricarboxylate transporter receptor subunit TctC